MSAFGTTGSIINVILCSLLLILFIAYWIAGEEAAFGGVLIGSVLLVVFVLTAAAVRPGKVDEPEHPVRNGVIHNYPSAQRTPEEIEADRRRRARRRGGAVIIHNYPSALKPDDVDGAGA